MNTRRSISLTCMIFLLGTAWCGTGHGQGKSTKWVSERNPFPFVGATRVVIDGFDSKDKNAASALLQLDKNEVIFSSFGESQITAVLYKPFQVQLTRLNMADPSGKDRRIFAVALPKDYAADLGQNSLRLVVPANTTSEAAGIRLLVVNPQDKVTQVLELRPASD